MAIVKNELLSWFGHAIPQTNLDVLMRQVVAAVTAAPSPVAPSAPIVAAAASSSATISNNVSAQTQSPSQ